MTTDHRRERVGSEQELAYGADAGCWAVYVTIYCYYYILSFCEQRQTAVLLVIDVCRWQRWHRGKIRHFRGCPLWFGGGCLLCLPFVASAASVLCCLTLVPDIICPGMYTCVFWIGAMFCDRLPFHRCVVSWFQTVRQQSSLLLRCSPASRLLRFVPCILIAIRLLHFLPSSITSDELRLLAQTY